MAHCHHRAVNSGVGADPEGGPQGAATACVAENSNRIELRMKFPAIAASVGHSEIMAWLAPIRRRYHRLETLTAPYATIIIRIGSANGDFGDYCYRGIAQ
jgi:hypothetical protein